MIKKPANQTHHGNLREALVLAGLQILETEGLEALTLRRCAKLAGVSHAAPAHHFAGLPGLKSAIATRGYRIFERLMLEGIKAEDTPRGRVLGMCRGYLRFATEHRALFNLVFVSPWDFPEDAERIRAADSARKVLTDTCAELAHGPGGAGTTEVAVWSLIHGFVKLVEIERVTPGSNDVRDIAFEDVFDFLKLEPM